MKSVDTLLEEVDVFMEQGEEKIASDLNAGYQKFQQAVANMLKVYLINNQQEPLGGLKALFFQCQKHNPEFDAIEDVVEIFTESEPGEMDGETITDAANEIWDFVTELYPAMEDEV